MHIFGIYIIFKILLFENSYHYAVVDTKTILHDMFRYVIKT